MPLVPPRRAYEDDDPLLGGDTVQQRLDQLDDVCGRRGGVWGWGAREVCRTAMVERSIVMQSMARRPSWRPPNVGPQMKQQLEQIRDRADVPNVNVAEVRLDQELCALLVRSFRGKGAKGVDEGLQRQLAAGRCERHVAVVSRHRCG
eukprot:Polyplicarium_translucidae@DN2989_c1_g1_i2.p3